MTTPLIQRPDSQQSQLSFTNLVEAHVLRVIREIHRVKLDKIRRALVYLGEQFGTEHPLAMEQFETDGVDLFVKQVTEDDEHTLINVSRGGQLAMREALKMLLTRVEWDSVGMASRFFPIPSFVVDPRLDKLIFLDPRIQFGKPILAHRGIPTAAIASLYDAGDTIDQIANEFDCTTEEINQAIQFESRQLAA